MASSPTRRFVSRPKRCSPLRSSFFHAAVSLFLFTRLTCMCPIHAPLFVARPPCASFRSKPNRPGPPGDPFCCLPSLLKPTVLVFTTPRASNGKPCCCSLWCSFLSAIKFLPPALKDSPRNKTFASWNRSSHKPPVPFFSVKPDLIPLDDSR